MKTALSYSDAKKAPELKIEDRDLSKLEKDTLIKIHKAECTCRWVGGILTGLAVIAAIVVAYFS